MLRSTRLSCSLKFTLGRVAHHGGGPHHYHSTAALGAHRHQHHGKDAAVGCLGWALLVAEDVKPEIEATLNEMLEDARAGEFRYCGGQAPPPLAAPTAEPTPFALPIQHCQGQCPTRMLRGKRRQTP